jgi:lipid-binding SYLF domain-containing protein
MKKALTLIATTILTLSIATAHAWDPREVDKLGAGSDEAKNVMLEKDPSMQKFFDTAAGWLIIPTVGKGGIGIGGARGKGLLYEGGKPSAIVTLTQLTVGFQWGGQTYSEFIFFKDGDALDKFKSNNYELGAQASAVAVTAGASADANYNEGVAVFTQAKGGLMYEATVGGQKFKVEMLEGDQ